MLLNLHVRNYVHFHNAELQLPTTGFCVLTGETGTGKSLVLGALSLLAGTRAVGGIVRKGAPAAELSANLAKSSAAVAWLTEAGFDVSDEQILIQRTIDINQRSKSYINGRPCTLAQLTEFTNLLVTICNQHEHIKLKEPVRQRELLDSFVEASGLTNTLAKAYEDWKATAKKLADAQQTEVQNAATRAEIEATLNELLDSGLDQASYQQHSKVLASQTNAVELTELVADASQILEQLETQASQVQTRVERIAELEGCDKQLSGIVSELATIAQETNREFASNFSEAPELDSKAIAVAENFIAETHRLMRKYGCPNPVALFEYMEQLQKQLDELASAGLVAATEAEAVARDAWGKLASKLSAKRATGATKLAKTVTGTLHKLGMANARFEIALEKLTGEPTAFGAEKIKFLFAARKSSSIQEISTVASGGELSRITLALIASAGGPTGAMVFDEIDTGVGGKVAAAVGALLSQIGKQQLVLSVTHLPQVAAAANQHWLVAQDGNGGFSLEELAIAERTEEIARMLAGKQVTAASRANAKEIIAGAKVA